MTQDQSSPPGLGAAGRIPTVDQLELHVQPVVRLSDGMITGWEALARGAGAEGVMSTPAEFIPHAERSGAIHGIGQWMLDGALGWLARYGRKRCTIAVNVSAVELEHPGFSESVVEALRRHSMPGDRLVLELTESVGLTDLVLARAVVSSLATAGVRVAIDDVGVGFADVALVRSLPAAILKLDRSLVAEIPSPEATAEAAAWIRLARARRMDVIAEGIRTDVQAEALRAMGCRWGQGDRFGAPVPAASRLPYS